MLLGNFLLALDGSGSLLVFDLLTFELTAQTTVLGAARDVVVDPRGERAYVTDESGNVSMISMLSFDKLLDIPTGGTLLGASVDPMGSFLYVVNHQLNNLDIIDLRPESATYRSISTRVPQQVNPVDVALSPDGLYAYCIVESDQRLAINTVGTGPMLGSLSRRSGPEGATVVLAGVDFTGGAVSLGGLPVPVLQQDDASITISIPSGAVSGPLMVLGSELGEVSNAINFEVLTETPAGSLHLASATQPAGAPPLSGAFAVSSSGRVAAVGATDGSVYLADVDPTSLNFNQFIAQTDPLTGPIVDLAMAPDGLSVFAVSGGVSSISLFNTNPGSASFGGLLAAVPLDGASPAYVTVSPDGRLVLAADPVAGTVHIVNWAAGPGGPIALGSPVGQMAFHPAGLHVYVATGSDITVLDLTGAVLGTAPVGNLASDLAFSPDGNLCYVLTGPETSGDRALITLDTSLPSAPANIGSLPLPATAAAMAENLMISPAGDRALLNIRDHGLVLVDLAAGSFAAQPGIVADSAPLGLGFANDRAAPLRGSNPTILAVRWSILPC